MTTLYHASPFETLSDICSEDEIVVQCCRDSMPVTLGAAKNTLRPCLFTEADNADNAYNDAEMVPEIWCCNSAPTAPGG